MSSLVIRQISSSLFNSIRSRSNISLANMSTKTKFETLSITVPKPFVYNVELNRPDKLNAFNGTMWHEIGQCFKELHTDPDCRVVILSGSGKLFTAGLDFKAAIENSQEWGDVEDVGRKAKILYKHITAYQNSMSSLELCHKPVLAAVHSACIGAGTSLITAADMRYCTKDAWFQVKEIILGMAADVGVLQRLPKIIGSDSLARELCYTARKMDAAEALSSGLVSKVYEDKESMMKGVLEIAEDIAAKSPIAIQGTKRAMVYSRDHSVQEGLEQIALYNQLMLQSEDFTNGVVALATKQSDITFAKL
ncbi:hypothetical protein ILUMI_23605 [Ignelater luminosus]|uniref:Delta(3,5)-Delta(2,4)-dienoyl-CoA isomerase, mitochondrial n=1 Tax=Ignelater luminosus TaxID=2038154 RepID=A0A8K0CDL9_IGNLU|nr:hypothetical protein ILUMI_23605 [Ignelater luminosus]